MFCFASQPFACSSSNLSRPTPQAPNLGLMGRGTMNSRSSRARVQCQPAWDLRGVPTFPTVPTQTLLLPHQLVVLYISYARTLLVPILI